MSNIIVLAHSHCGGIRALLNADSTDNNFISSWMNIASEAKKKVLTEYKNQSLEQQEKICEEESLLISLKNLRTFSWVDDKVRVGTLSLHAWRFDLSTGIIKKFNEALNQFEDL